jgi:hypothetical protein
MLPAEVPPNPMNSIPASSAARRHPANAAPLTPPPSMTAYACIAPRIRVNAVTRSHRIDWRVKCGVRSSPRRISSLNDVRLEVGRAAVFIPQTRLHDSLFKHSWVNYLVSGPVPSSLPAREERRGVSVSPIHGCGAPPSQKVYLGRPELKLRLPFAIPATSARHGHDVVWTGPSINDPSLPRTAAEHLSCSLWLLGFFPMHSDSQQCLNVVSCYCSFTAITRVQIPSGTPSHFNSLGVLLVV